MKHCPKCQLEYEDDAVTCSDCGARLRKGPRDRPAETPHPDVTLERVYATGDPAVIPLVKSLLDDDEIQYLAKGETIQDLFGWGRLGSGFNYVVGPVEFFVASEDAGRARELLSRLQDRAPEDSPDEG
ncbi:MAG TPA: DUF2007 domain-containing protein [Candidatus Eisenbacteria bacterium]|jgi:hypothetical protein|nr:DUF2007 domain-containing protein [Candidatus Eisenbacteria bacterium]